MTHSHLLLIRHSESVKNVRSSFATVHEMEGLTDLGKEQAATIAKSVLLIKQSLALENVSLYSAESSRSQETASIIADYLESAVKCSPGLSSIGSGSMAGLSEQEVLERFPDFASMLDLYRAGLCSSYKINRHDGESLPMFEERIVAALTKLVTQEQQADLTIVVAHRSPITAFLIHCARRIYDYPDNFFGYVALPYASASWVGMLGPDPTAIHAVGVDATKLIQRLRSINAAGS